MDTIKINDIERPIKFGVWAIKEFAKIKGMDLDTVIGTLDKLGTEDTISLIYCGFLYGAKVEKIEIDFDEDDVWFWIDEDPDLANKVMNVFSKNAPNPKKDTPQEKGQ